MPGRPRKPTQLRVIESGGKLRARYRRHAEREPVPPPGIGPVPAILSDEQRAKWAEFDAAAPPGLLTALDRPLFQQYVATACAADRALDLFNRSGGNPLARGADSRDPIVTNAAWRELRRIGEQLRALASEFGSSPAARTRIELEPAPDGADPMARFFGPAR